MIGNPKDVKIDLNKLTSSYKKNKKPYTLDPIMILELTKAMMGRGVDYETAEQIIVDFHKRMERF